MSYRIEYDASVGKFEVQKTHPWRFPFLCFISVGVFLLGLAVFKPSGFGVLRSILIPGEDAVTVSAFQIMANDLRSGAGFYDAFCDFCRMIVHGA